MNKRYNRRDFLKAAGALSLHAAGLPLLRRTQNPAIKNILIIVFDAFSARHISLYGYDRKTTPNIARLAEQSIVYHNHYAGGNFTTPGTASLLTGTLPWTHRANGFYSPVAEEFKQQNIFSAFDRHYTIAYSHNPLAARLFQQFERSINEFIPVDQFLLTSDMFVDELFNNDVDTASVSWERIMKNEGGASYSLLLSRFYKYYQQKRIAGLRSQFPLGLPNIKGESYFTLEDVIDWLGSEIQQFPRPFLGYFHFLPPHFPYATRAEFHGRFNKDKYAPVEKPEDLFTKDNPPSFLDSRRQYYDEYILYADSEFGKLFDTLQSSGILNDTMLVLTSDHGELFERGIMGHTTPVLYEPVVRIPLMIFEPGRSARTDIHARTSAVDILPTLLHITGKPAPTWTEGMVLPPFANTDMSGGRNINIVYAKLKADADEALVKVTLASINGDYKLTYFSGYKELNGQERVELYNLKEDPEELNNIYSVRPDIAKPMLDELKNKLAKKDKKYS